MVINVKFDWKNWKKVSSEHLKNMDRQRLLALIGGGIGLLFAVTIIYCYYMTNHVFSVNQSLKSLRVELETVAQERDTLASENKALQEKVSILSDTINSKVKEEEEREAEAAKAHMPTGFPIHGTVSYNEENTTLEGNPVAEFTAAAGTSIIATGEGTVSSIAGDAAVGYIVMVDHGNGYFSVYRNGSTPKVEEGAEIPAGAELFVIEGGHEKLEYQIIRDNQYINPLDFMEIYG